MNSSENDFVIDMILLDAIFGWTDTDPDVVLDKKPRKKYKKKTMWVRKIYQKRPEIGAYETVVRQLAGFDSNLYKNYMRMTLPQFELLLGIVGPYISKEICIRKPISAAERLAMTIRYLASGDSQKSLSYAYCCSPTVIHNIIKETTKVVWEQLKTFVFPEMSKQYFESVAAGFENQWDFPNCIGAIDGKHINIQAPAKSGSNYFNYKKSHSVVLLAIVDHNYNFIMCDIGATGRQSDGGVFRNSEFGKAFLDNKLNLPEPRNISQRHKNMPFVFVADDAFALKENMLKPYSKRDLTLTERIFNYRLSRVRRIVEDGFGILASKFRIFRKPIIADVKIVENIVGACVCLHNWLKMHQEDYISPGLVDVEQQDGSIVPGEWRNHNNSCFRNLNRAVYNATDRAKNIRNEFADYFINEGSVPWQLNKI